MFLPHGTVERPSRLAQGSDAKASASRWHRLMRRLHRWRQLRHERRQLWSLSDAALKDIGLSRADSEREARRPFWDDRGWDRNER